MKLVNIYIIVLFFLNSYTQNIPECNETQINLSTSNCILLGDEIEIDSEAGFVGIVEAGDDIDELFGSIPPFTYEFDELVLTSLLIIHLVNILNF